MAVNSFGADTIALAESLIKKYFANKNLPQTMEVVCCDYVRQILSNVSIPDIEKHAVLTCLENLKPNIDDLDTSGDPAFIVAAWENEHTVMHLLKLLGCNVNATDKNGNSALIAVAMKEYVPKETVTLLFSLGTNLNTKNKSGKTALMLAIERGNLELVQLLVHLGADIHIKNNYQEDALTIAKLYNQTGIYQFLSKIAHPTEVKQFKATDKKSVQISLASFQALLSAETLSEKAIVDLSAAISEGNIDPNTRLGPDNVPALVFALRNQNLKAAELLIKLGADKKCLSEKHPPKNESILYALAMRTFVLKKVSDKERDIIYFLLDNKVDLNVGSINQGEENTPLASAKRLRNTLFLEVLNDYFLNKTQTLPEVLTANTNPGLKKKLDNAKAVKEAGHVLGFSTIIANTHSESFDDVESFPLLRDYITHYANHNPSSLVAKHYNQENSQIKEALDLAIQWQQADGKITHQTFLDHYNAGKLTILPVSAKGHSFTLIACNDLLIVCNRGGQQLDEPISVFKIPEIDGEPGRITKQFLESVIPENTKPELNDVVSSIKQFVDIPNSPPIMTFPSHEQKHGTCTFVNIKSSLLPMLFLSELFSSSPLSDAGFELDSVFLTRNKDMIQCAASFNALEKTTQQAYKAFTEDMRNQKVNELCNAYKKSDQDPEKKAVLLAIFKAILKEHHGQTVSGRDNRKRTEKMKNEKRRAEQILNVLAPDEKHAIITEILSNYLKNQNAYPGTIKWLQAQDSMEADKENTPFTPLRVHVNHSKDKLKEVTGQTPTTPKRPS